MRFKQLLPIVVITFFLTSCAYFPVPGSYREALDCYDSTYTGIDTLINIHGFYREMEVYDHTGLSKKVDGKWVKLG